METATESDDTITPKKTKTKKKKVSAKKPTETKQVEEYLVVTYACSENNIHHPIMQKPKQKRQINEQSDLGSDTTDFDLSSTKSTSFEESFSDSFSSQTSEILDKVSNLENINKS